MARNNDPAFREIQAALAELDQLSQGEYGLPLEELLADPSPNSELRVQRLAGIMLKRPFARQAGPPPSSVTNARRSWPWADQSPEARASAAAKEFAVLDQLRMPGPWNERKPLAGTGDDLVPIPWSELQGYADHERGLFKILTLYVDDRLKGRDGKTLREYMEADESPRFEAGLDLATLVFEASVTAPLIALLGIPGVAVGIALVGIQYGYRRATDPVERIGDRGS
jgi:hypothetical protein